MRDIIPKRKVEPAGQPRRKPDIQTPPPAFTYDPLNSRANLHDVIHNPVVKPADNPFEVSEGEAENIPLPQNAGTSSAGSDQKHQNIKSSKPLKSKILRVVKWLLIIGILGAIATFALVSFQVTKISTNPFSWGKLKGEADGRINILLLGVGDPGHAGEGLADTNMIVSLNTKASKVAMISIPRDTRVKVPGYGYQKINNAHAEGEIPLAIKTIEQNLDVPIHYYVTANFTGLKQAVDAVGGVDINVTDRLYDPEYPCDTNEYRSCGFKLNPGQIHMDGTLALKYARCRKGSCGDDFGRALRQQQVLQAVRSKASSTSTLANPAKLNALLGSAANNIKTDLSINNIMRLKDLSKKFDMDHVINVVFSLQPNGFLKGDPSGSTDLLPIDSSFESIQKFVAEVFTLGPVWSEQPTVVIENGTATVGVAKKLADTISNGPYGDLITINAMMSALTRDHTTSTITDYTGGKKPATAAYLQSLVKVAPTTPPLDAKGKPTTGIADFVIILGTDYVTPTPATSTKR